MNNDGKRLYAAWATVSGIALPPQQDIYFWEGLITPNSQALGLVPDGIFAQAANVTTETVSKGRSREVARWLLAFQFQSGPEIPSRRTQAHAERIILPLRLISAGRILLSMIGTTTDLLNEVIVKGSTEPAEEMAGQNLVTELDEEKCQQVASSLPALLYNPTYQSALDRYSSADYLKSPSSVGLNYLIAIETMFSFDNKIRGRASEIPLIAAPFAADDQAKCRWAGKLLSEAYRHRNPILHGETDMTLIENANNWFAKNAWELRGIASVCFQRVLRLTNIDEEFNLKQYSTAIRDGDTRLLNHVFELPVLAPTKVHEVHRLGF